MVDLDADRAGVDGAGLAGVFAVSFKFGRWAGTEKAERVEVAFEISPLAVSVENAFAFGIGAVIGFSDWRRRGAAIGCLESSVAIDFNLLG